MKKEKKKRIWDKEKVILSPSREEFLAKQELKHNIADNRRKEKRSSLERFFDRHNHKMEFIRTLFGLLTIGLQLVILAKLFNLI